ncbi:hypothetical protein B7463_g3580, partial [Scytalidium lignicola]
MYTLIREVSNSGSFNNHAACTSPIDNSITPWAYCPSFPAALVASAVFGLTIVAHIALALRYHKAFCWVIIMATIWEAGGFGIRTYATDHQLSTRAFNGQQIITLLAPLWVNAFLYMLLGRMIDYFVPEKTIGGIYSHRIALIFVWADVITFVIQLAGAVMVSIPDSSYANSIGKSVYMGGVGLQQASLLSFLLLAILFHRRLRSGFLVSGDTLWHPILFALYTVVTLITIRTVYRLVEFSAGLNGTIPTHEWFMYVFDTLPMFCAILVLAVWHPGSVLQGPGSEHEKIRRHERQKLRVQTRREVELDYNPMSSSVHPHSQIANHHVAAIPAKAVINGDLNNTTVLRETKPIEVDPEYSFRSFAISEEEDDPEIRDKYRPFILDSLITATDWISKLELGAVAKLAEENIQKTGERLRILVLYAFEASRILFRLGCDVRVFNPAGLPVKDDIQHSHPKVQELRELSKWSDGHLWISPEQHGNLVSRLYNPHPHYLFLAMMYSVTNEHVCPKTAVFKNQIDWIPLSAGSIRPTQGRTLAVAEVSGGSQSFNAVNSLRILGRWMRMFVIPNQASVPIAWKQFTAEDAADPIEGSSRMLPSGNRMRIVDCMEELVKYTIVMRPHFALFGDRYSERVERAQ